jgi:hypothetical protein
MSNTIQRSHDNCRYRVASTMAGTRCRKCLDIGYSTGNRLTKWSPIVERRPLKIKVVAKTTHNKRIKPAAKRRNAKCAS